MASGEGRDKMRMAIIGCGEVARAHLRTVKKLRDIDVVALCDRNEKAAAAMSKEWNIGRCYTDYRNMLDRENLTIVSVLTPPQFHASMVLDAIEHGVNVLVEKPLTMSSQEAQQVVDAVKRRAVKVAVNHDWLSSRVMTTALFLFRSGAIGKILGMDVTILHTQDDPMASNEKHWCHTILGGRFGEMLAHPVYVIQSFLGYDLKVDGTITDKLGSYSWMKHDELHVTLRRSAVPGNIYVSFNSPRPAVLIDIYGTKMVLRVDTLNQIVMKSGHRTFSKMDSARDCLGLSSQLFGATIQNGLRFLFLETGEYGLHTSYLSLKRSIEMNQEPLVTAEMGYAAVKTVEEICKSI